MKDIKDLHIGSADYYLENTQGSRLRLLLDYAEDSFKMEVIVRGKNLRRLKSQAVIIAKDMLGRKAQRNLIERFSHLESQK